MPAGRFTDPAFDASSDDAVEGRFFSAALTTLQS
jgi:hypothetical protein